MSTAIELDGGSALLLAIHRIHPAPHIASSTQHILDSQDPLAMAFLARIKVECTCSVSSFQTRFWCLTPPARSPALCASAPELFTSLNSVSFDSLYNLWLLIPIPSSEQLTLLRESRENTALPGCHSILVHRPPGFDHDLLLPIWMINCWTRLRTLLAYSKSWLIGKDWLHHPAQQDRLKTTAEQCLTYLSSIPLHTSIPAFLGLVTSRLPNFLGQNWLSDEEMNAGAHGINNHPDMPNSARMLNTHFIGNLALHRQRSAVWNPSHPRPVDTMIADGRLDNLYMIVHQHNHWTFMRINVPAGQYQYTDSMDLHNLYAPAECVNLLNWWMSSVLSRPISLTPLPRSFNADLQLDSHSCGFAVLQNIAHMALGSKFRPWLQSSASLIRMKLFLWVASGYMHQDDGHGQTTPLLDFDPDESIYTESGVTSSIQSPPLSPDHTSLPDSLLSPFGISSSPAVSPTQSDISNYGTHATEISECNSEPSEDTPRTQSGPRLVQTQLPFKKISRMEYDAQEHERFAKLKDQCQIERERDALQQVRAQLIKTTYERERKRVQRTMRRAMQIETGLRSADGKLKKRLNNVRRNLDSNQSSGTSKLAEISRPARAYKDQEKKLRRQKSGNRDKPYNPAPAVRVNWANPLLWGPIDTAAQKEGFPWSSTGIVRRVKQFDPVMFASLRPQRISSWRDRNYPNELRWKESHLRAVARGNSASTSPPGGSVLVCFVS
ncbi:Ulp1 protease family, carboxy-terminal catalytic domain protein [Ceratobasidium sp. AG-Ba]|nr:Ulp1 protease family, carboxy-terminal catalytic domain protein [Ceratobasidium sp. AG-Ba]QRW06833.1 Ulp1 protease family, carboxy-terminal catalytic domain protein [Ceratobasidium sp. AG-Ba]